jgi:hypothetical protein
MIKYIGLALSLMLASLPAMANDLSNATWSEVDSSNNAASPNGWTSGTMTPSQVEPTARAMMGATKRFYNHINATKTSGGSANTQTLTYSVAPAAYATGDAYAFIAGFTNTGSATLNVNSLGAKTIKVGTVPLTAGQITVGRVVNVYYDGTDFQLGGESLGVIAQESVVNHGAKRDLQSGIDGTITSGTTTFSSSTATFLATDCNVSHGNGCTGTADKIISIDYAGGAGSTGGTPLITTIVGFTNSTTVTLADAASNTVPYTIVNNLATATSLAATSNSVGTITGYVPGVDNVTLTGGTFTTAGVLAVYGTRVTAAAIVAAGSGGTVKGGSGNGRCTVRGTTGTPARALTEVTLTAGEITAIYRHLTRGFYTTNPTDPANEPVTGDLGQDSFTDEAAEDTPSAAPPCSGLTGAILSYDMGPSLTTVSNVGKYSVAPSSPVSQGSTTGVGTGATWTVPFVGAGYYNYSTDDSAAFKAAVDAANVVSNAGGRACVYIPPGIYGLRAETIPIFAKNGCVYGNGSQQSVMVMDPGYSGDIWSWSNAWIGTTHHAGTIDNIAVNTNQGPSIQGLSIRGDKSSANTQNAMMFYDRNDDAYINDVTVYSLPGRCLSVGEVLNGSIAYMRESFIPSLGCFKTGTSALPAVELKNASTGQGPLHIGRLSIYGSPGKSLHIHNGIRDVSISQLRVEGVLNGLGDHLVQIADATDTLNTYQIRIAQLRMTNVPPTKAGLVVVANGASAMPYNISVANGTISGGYNWGKGIDIQAGRNINLEFYEIASPNTNVTVAAAPATAEYVRVNGMDTGFSSSIGTAANFLSPLVMSGQVGSRIPLSSSLPYLAPGCQSGVALTTTAAVETNLASCVLPALKKNDRIEVLTSWSWPNSANNKTPAVRLHTAAGTGGTLYTGFTASTVASARCRTVIQNTGNTKAQKGAGSAATNCVDTTAGGTPVTSTNETSNGTTTININVTGNGAGETMSLDSYGVWIYPGPT